ncbi:MAG: NADH-quinone oxidoreductase subunit H [Elusimicrobia bacterium]|nr:NADH-quinone oxidoreductase subunit H [Elusimicrobiota bacterium]
MTFPLPLNDVVFAVAKILFSILGVGLSIAGFLGWVERKQSAVMQDRIGANRASIFGFTVLGLFHPIADAIKLLTKEDFVPKGARKPLHGLAPIISLGCGMFCLAALPYGGVVDYAGRAWDLTPIALPMGVPLVLAALAFGVHGIVMAGYASGSNYGLLGAMRGAAQMIAYEVCLASALAGLLFVYGTLDFTEAVRWQVSHGVWGIFLQPLAFIIFLTAGTAVTKRVPFDLPEGESEIVGYHVEYSGMKFGMFMMTDFFESIVICGVITALFLGGWSIPFVDFPSLAGRSGLWGLWPVAAGALMVGSSVGKILLMLFLLMQVRWTLPRFRFDQVLDLGWKHLLPLALINFLVTVWVVYLWR